jgi:hypothetical protein
LAINQVKCPLRIAADIIGDPGCAFAIDIALFPIAPHDNTSATVQWIGYIVLAFAALFFFPLIYFSLFLLTRADPDKAPTPRKAYRNVVCKVCGWVMAACKGGNDLEGHCHHGVKGTAFSSSRRMTRCWRPLARAAQHSGSGIAAMTGTMSGCSSDIRELNLKRTLNSQDTTRDLL